ncbi:CaiB/BaiF CoA transferase family protein [Sphingomicrobium nitratireducens]|uniref:CaiB/BaiF CoA transferase family protein n=1 Tax=Sphingomicrobium nitratireducens TaxID=2964666 RepID=UPI00223FA8C1|nr:CaiB/BaiF CoA-transferase family protein [Sphingomicrobium nitratireducens]
MVRAMAGPLSGTRIIELAGLGPGPFAGMMLADHGAEVIRIERAGLLSVPGDPLLRGRRSIMLDLKREEARAVVVKLVAGADALIDPFRPGKLEALGLGPEALHAVNPKLVIGRITGWGQSGPLADRAGHDINYLALSGLLSTLGPGDRPLPPANLVADYAGGGMMLAFAIAAALREVAAGASEGRVIDCAMAEGAALIGSLMFGMRNAGQWREGREANLLDGGAPFYTTYPCADGLFVAVGAIEPAFRAALLGGLGLSEDARFVSLFDPDDWPAQRAGIAERFAAQPRAHWLALFEGTDACVSPVLGMDEAAEDAHMEARGAFARLESGVVPAPAPRYGAEAEPISALGVPGGEGRAILAELGLGDDEIDDLLGGNGA